VEDRGLAERLGDQDVQLRTLRGLWIDCRNLGAHRQAVQIANRFCDLAALWNTIDDMLVAEPMIGMSCFISGNFRDARRHVQLALTSSSKRRYCSGIPRFLSLGSAADIW
jgi:hypothetical protein